jgi:predicted amidohydrolase YtcJ
MCFACGPIGRAVFSGLTRRAFLSGSGVALGAASLAGSGGPFSCDAANAATETGDTLYVGGPILTMTDATPMAEAVLVRGGRIAAVGARAGVEKQARGPVLTVDLKGAAMLPGFFDPHGHVVMVGLQTLAANLLPPPDGNGKSIAALQRILREWISRNGKIIERYKLIVGFGYDDSQLEEQRHPTRADLDAVSPDLPIVVVHQSGHLSVLSSKALEEAGVGKETPNPPGGVFRREADGATPNGVAEQTANWESLAKLFLRLDEAAFLAMVEEGAKSYARYGYTTAQEGRATGATAGIVAKAAAIGKLPVDVLVFPDILDFASLVQPTPGYENHYRIGGAKLTIDGSPQGKTAYLTQPYFVPPEGQTADYRGYATITREQLLDAFDLAYANNWQIVTHANGDAAVDWLIEAVRETTAKHGAGDRRPVLIHGQVTRLEQLPQLKELGIIPSFFPMHTFYWGDWHRDSVLGPERAAHISPCNSARKLGMIFTTHHDAPVANPDSIRVLSATVTRVTRSGYILGPEERVDTLTALKAMTIWPAAQHFEEARKGSIKPGKLADFVILDRNPVALAPEDLITLKVVETIKEGRSIYKAA